MFAIPVEGLPLNRREQAFCRRAGIINASQLLFASPEDSAKTKQLFESTNIDHIKDIAARVQAPKSTPVLDALQAINFDLEGCFRKEDDASSVSVISAVASTPLDHERSKANDYLRVTCGDEDMDAVLGGGWRRGCLTEIVGESSSGKSQLIMQTAVFIALGLKTMRRNSTNVETSKKDSTLEGDDVYNALGGCGIGRANTRGSVAILHSGGHGVGHIMTRRLEQLASSLIKERWDFIHREATHDDSSEGLSRGMFQEAASANTLKEVQGMARKILLENIHVASPQGYDSLEHTVLYTLPALHEALKKQGKAPLSMVMIDDLPEIVLDEEKHFSRIEMTLKRSRLMGELADRLKKLSLLPTQPVGTQCGPAMVIIAVNHVVGLFPKNLDLSMPVLQDKNGCSEGIVAAGPPPLNNAYQESYYDGSLINGDLQLLQKRVREGKTSYEEEGKRAGLGSPWVHCINVRIMMIKTRQIVTAFDYENEREEVLNVRRAIGIFNPFADGENQVEFVIRHHGFQSLSRCRLYGQREEREEEESLWSSLDEDISAADMNRLLEDEERLRMKAQQ